MTTSSKSNLKSQPLHTESQFEIDALKKENLRLQREVAKLKAKNTTLESQITILTEEYTKYKHNHPSFDLLTEQQREWIDECKQCLKRKSLRKDLKPT